VTVGDVSVGVVGATGLVGTEMLLLLDQRNFPVDELRAYASPRSEGRALPFKDGEVVCQVLADGCFDGLDLVKADNSRREPVSYVVFRAGSRELRADGVPRLDAMADGDLVALLGALQGGSDTAADRASARPPRAPARSRRTLLRGAFGFGALGI